VTTAALGRQLEKQFRIMNMITECATVFVTDYTAQEHKAIT